MLTEHTCEYGMASLEDSNQYYKSVWFKQMLVSRKIFALFSWSQPWILTQVDKNGVM